MAKILTVLLLLGCFTIGCSDHKSDSRHETSFPKQPEPLKWADVLHVLKNPGSVSERILEVYKPSIVATKRIQLPESSPNPHSDFELTLWKSDIPGLTMITTKTNKSNKKDREGKAWLSNLVVDVAIYTEYLKSRGDAIGLDLAMTTESALRLYPNARYGEVDAKGTGTLFQALWELGDDPLAYVQMSFVTGHIKTIKYGKDSEWVKQLLAEAKDIGARKENEADAEKPAATPQTKSEARHR